ncbi:MAG: bifunctional riboflavin kinase/FAD synthetase [Eubacteriales bacterium]|nr:bifunctional riboflavin kinase/FAD synthetase [Eubacteriales bacterium]
MSEAKFVIALGMFDGVHIGHRALLSRAKEIALEHGATCTVFTFSNHPLELFDAEVRYLCTNEQRRELFLELGMDRVDMIPFESTIAELSAEGFVELLQQRYLIDTLVVGFNYSFSKGGRGNPAALERLGNEYGFAVEVIPPVMVDDIPVSSTRIRELLKEGNVIEAERLLKREYSLRGAVVPNKQLGRRIGFPTANILEGNMAIPKDGVYATRAILDGIEIDAVTNVGTNPTVHGDKRTIETHLIDTDAELYGREIEIRFAGYLRGEKTFNNTEELSKQITEDIINAKKVLKRRK